MKNAPNRLPPFAREGIGARGVVAESQNAATDVIAGQGVLKVELAAMACELLRASNPIDEEEVVGNPVAADPECDGDEREQKGESGEDFQEGADAKLYAYWGEAAEEAPSM